MPLINRSRVFAPRPERCVATIGNFDGLHLGHAALLQALFAAKQRRRAPSLLLSFEPLSQEFFQARQNSYRILGWRDKATQLFAYPELDYFYTLSFNPSFSQMSARDFLDRYVLALGVQSLVVGHDFAFGARRSGDLELLKKYTLEHDIELVVLDAVTESGNTRVSSSLIREHLRLGELAEVQSLLGASYKLSGKVIYGRQLGRSLGFPTANLHLNNRNPALHGVYAAWARLINSNDTNSYAAAVNIGWRPSVEAQADQLSCEAHLLGFDSDIYGQRLELSFSKRIREEQKFQSLDGLKAQIVRDVSEVKRHLALEAS